MFRDCSRTGFCHESKNWVMAGQAWQSEAWMRNPWITWTSRWRLWPDESGPRQNVCKFQRQWSRRWRLWGMEELASWWLSTKLVQRLGCSRWTSDCFPSRLRNPSRTLVSEWEYGPQVTVYLAICHEEEGRITLLEQGMSKKSSSWAKGRTKDKKWWTEDRGTDGNSQCSQEKCEPAASSYQQPNVKWGEKDESHSRGWIAHKRKKKLHGTRVQKKPQREKQKFWQCQKIFKNTLKRPRTWRKNSKMTSKSGEEFVLKQRSLVKEKECWKTRWKGASEKTPRFSGEIERKAKQAHVEVHGTCLRRTEQRRRTSSMTGYGSGPCGGARVEETARRNCKDVGNVGEPRGDKSLVILWVSAFKVRKMWEAYVGGWWALTIFQLVLYWDRFVKCVVDLPAGGHLVKMPSHFARSRSWRTAPAFGSAGCTPPPLLSHTAAIAAP